MTAYTVLQASTLSSVRTEWIEVEFKSRMDANLQTKHKVLNK
jgi:hypothetical protein